MFKIVLNKTGKNQRNPDVLVKGGDYDATSIVGCDIVKKRGGEIQTVEIKHNTSSTKIIERSKKKRLYINRQATETFSLSWKRGAARRRQGQRPSGAVRLMAHKRRGRLLRQPSPLGAQSTFLLLHQRCCGGKVLLRYFLTEKVTKR